MYKYKTFYQVLWMKVPTPLTENIFFLFHGFHTLLCIYLNTRLTSADHHNIHAVNVDIVDFIPNTILFKVYYKINGTINHEPIVHELTNICIYVIELLR